MLDAVHPTGDFANDVGIRYTVELTDRLEEWAVGMFGFAGLEATEGLIGEADPASRRHVGGLGLLPSAVLAEAHEVGGEGRVMDRPRVASHAPILRVTRHLATFCKILLLTL